MFFLVLTTRSPVESMFADCRMLKCREWMNGYRRVIDQCANSSVAGIITSRSHSFSSSPFRRRPPLPRHTPFLRDVPARTTRHNGRFGMEASGQTAPILTGIDALPHLVVRKASPIVWYTTLRTPTYNRAQQNPQQPAPQRPHRGGKGGRKRGGEFIFLASLFPISDRPGPFSTLNDEIHLTGESISTTV